MSSIDPAKGVVKKQFGGKVQPFLWGPTKTPAKQREVRKLKLTDRTDYYELFRSFQFDSD
jgi:hypothetical protein